jgi:hypothetical protein
MNTLFEKAQWMHPTLSQPNKPHCHFDSFWSDPPVSASTSTRKRKIEPIKRDQEPIETSTQWQVSSPMNNPVSGYEGDPVSGPTSMNPTDIRETSVSDTPSQPVSGHKGEPKKNSPHNPSVSDETHSTQHSKAALVSGATLTTYHETREHLYRDIF